MPMDFPDMQSLLQAAQAHGFRRPLAGEAEAAYRDALANHVRPLDYIESQEIRLGIGWDKWDQKQNKDMFLRRLVGF